jgi:hypothetical protein
MEVPTNPTRESAFVWICGSFLISANEIRISRSTSHVPKSRICLTPDILSHDVNRWSSSGVTALKLAAPNAQIHKFSKANLVSGLASHYTLFWWGG